MPGLLRPIALLAGLALLAGCESPIDFNAPSGPKIHAPRTPVSQPAGLPPPPGRTNAERQARRDYYSGPRGDEF